ncbi:MAG: hypothetical protein NTW04_01225 [Elusimicrobia bacterium]|nr:hypothetical protein [Elusimicrobiota bacterium]
MSVRINLIPQEIIDKQKQKIASSRAVAAGAIVALCFIIFTGFHISSALRAEAKFRQRQIKLKDIQAKVEKVKQLEAVKTAAYAHLEAINDIMRKRFHYAQFLMEIAASMTSTMWFASVNANTKPDGAIDFSVSALAKSAEDVAGWLNVLETNPKFANPVLGPISANSDGAGGKTHSFTLAGTYLAGS